MRAPTPLTSRQREVIGLVARGLTNREIAGALGLSEDGVKAHVSRLLLRFGVSNRVELLNATRAWEADSARAYAALATGSTAIAAAGERTNGDLGGLRANSVAMLNGWDRASRGSEGASAGLSPRVLQAVDDLRRALQEMSIAIELGKDLPADAATGRVFATVERRLHLAVAASETLGSEIARADLHPVRSARPRATREPQRRGAAHR